MRVERLRGLVALSIVVVALGAGTAQASTVSLEYRPSTTLLFEPPDDHSVLVVSGGDGASAIAISAVGLDLRFADAGEPVVAGDGCVQDGDHAALCDQALAGAPATAAELSLGAGDDRLDELPASLAVRANGGAGADVLSGGDQADDLRGGEGEDVIAAGAGDDRASGGPDADAIDGQDGNDVVDGGTGADDVDGGAGTDAVSYAGLTDDVEVDLQSAEPAGDGDTIAAFESAIGGDGDDTLKGTAGRNVLDGGPGNDTVHGRSGDDVVIGGAGRNELTGGNGTDTLDESWTALDGVVRLPLDPETSAGSAAFGDGSEDEAVRDTLFAVENARTGAGDDRLAGGDGRNVLRGGAGDDELRGLAGDDELLGEGGDDDLGGGDGNDDLQAGIGADVGFGNAGNDVLRPGGDGFSPCCGRGDLSDAEGADHVNGGPGIDRVDYSDRLHPVTVDLGVAGGQGEMRPELSIAENDVIERVERAGTGAGADVVRGSPVVNRLEAGDGDDRIEARDGGPDDVRCGSGTDTAVVDASDTTSGCEVLDVAVPGPAPGPPAGDPRPTLVVPPRTPVEVILDDVTTALADLGARRVARRARRGVFLVLPAQFLRPGLAAVTLRRAGRRPRVLLARGGVRRSSPGPATLRLRMTRRGRRLLRRKRVRRVRVSVRFVDGGSGAREAAAETIRLKPPVHERG